MSNPNGTRWETRLVKWFNENGWPYVERRARSGRNDRGDLAGLPGICVEAKNVKALSLAKWMDEALVEQVNAGAQFTCVIFPRKNCETKRAYVLMELEQFAKMANDGVQVNGQS